MCVEDGCMYNLSPDSPIGIMDSGMGGISVLREIVKVLPNEDFIFYGDSCNELFYVFKLNDLKEYVNQHSMEQRKATDKNRFGKVKKVS